MTNSNNNNNVNQWKLDLPATATVAYYNSETDQNLTGEEWQVLNSTSPSQFQVVNRGEAYQSEKALNAEPSYGHCSYSGCPWPSSVPCKLDIDIEGINRKWARRAGGNGYWLPGYWEPGNFDSSQLSRWSLILEDVDEFRRVLPLLSNDVVYTINLMGRHCNEDTRFCNASIDLIEKTIKAHHERGVGVHENVMLDSNLAKLANLALRIGTTAALSTINPIAGLATAGMIHVVGRAAQEDCTTNRGKSFWGGVSDVGISSAQGLMAGEAAKAGGWLVGSGMTGGNLFCAEEAAKLAGNIETWTGLGMDGYHAVHLGNGKSYDSDCPVCKPKFNW